MGLDDDAVMVESDCLVLMTLWGLHRPRTMVVVAAPAVPRRLQAAQPGAAYLELLRGPQRSFLLARGRRLVSTAGAAIPATPCSIEANSAPNNSGPRWPIQPNPGTVR